MSTGPHSFLFHIGDYLRDTRGLSLAEHGAYLLLMLEYYATGKPLPADKEYLYRLTGARGNFTHQVVDRVLARYFHNGAGCYTHKRIINELHVYALRSSSARLAALHRYQKNPENQGAHSANAAGPHSERSAVDLPTNTYTNTNTNTNTKTLNPKPKNHRGSVVRTVVLSNTTGKDTFAHSLARSAEEFDAFWQKFPRKRSKGVALKAWLALHPTQELQAAILAALDLAIQSQDWRKDGGAFIPYPATWLRARGWEDEHTTGPVSKTGRSLMALERIKKRG